MVDQELGAQASIQTQINATLEARIKKLEEINDSLSRQLKITRDIQSSMDGNQSGIDGTNKLAAASDKAATSQSNLASKALEVQKTQAKIKENIGGITNAFGSWFSSVTNIASALGGVVGTLLNFGKALISVPFDIFDAFIEKANALPYNTALFQALQEIKKAFGDLATGPGKAVADNLKTIRHNMRDLVGTGLTLHSVFGYGPEGAAEALKAVNDLAVQLGASFFNLTGFIRKSGLEMVVMAKGLGLSNEQMAQQIKFAQAMGKDPKKAQDEFASAAIQTAKAFGMAHKVIARGMSDLLQQFPNLAKQGPKALAPIVAYAQKLGIEIKDLTGVMDKFSSFEGAADATSQLSQAFGVNVDAMRIMAAESPAEKLEMLRKGFQSAGVDSEHMSYSQRKLAKDLTGATDALFDQAFGLGNQKVKLSETEKQAQQAMKTQMEHTKIMKELGKAIEKIAPPEPKKFKGFFEAFAEGFSDGIFYTHEMRKAMWALRSSMTQIYWAGREVGRIFVEYFPGVKKMLEGVYNIFKPSNFRHLRTEIIPIFREFFQDMDFGKLFDNLSNAVNRTLGNGTGTGLGQLKQGFMSFTAAAGKVIGTAIQKIGDLITEGIIGITEIIRNPSGFLEKVGAGTNQAMTVGQSFLNPIAKGFAKAGPQVWNAITGLFGEIWNQVKAWWKKEGKEKAVKFLSDYKWEIIGILALMNPGAVLSAAANFGGLLFNVTKLGFEIVSKNPQLLQNAGSFITNMFPTFSKLGSAGTRAVSSLSGALGGVAKMALKGAGVVGVATSVVAGLVDGFQSASKESGTLNKISAFSENFGATTLHWLTLGLVDKETIKKMADSFGSLFYETLEEQGARVDAEFNEWNNRRVAAANSPQNKVIKQAAISAMLISPEEIRKVFDAGGKNEGMAKELQDIFYEGNQLVDNIRYENRTVDLKNAEEDLERFTKEYEKSRRLYAKALFAANGKMDPAVAKEWERVIRENESWAQQAQQDIFQAKSKKKSPEEIAKEISEAQGKTLDKLVPFFQKQKADQLERYRDSLDTEDPAQKRVIDEINKILEKKTKEEVTKISPVKALEDAQEQIEKAESLEKVQTSLAQAQVKLAKLDVTSFVEEIKKVTTKLGEIDEKISKEIKLGDFGTNIAKLFDQISSPLGQATQIADMLVKFNTTYGKKGTFMDNMTLFLSYFDPGEWVVQDNTAGLSKFLQNFVGAIPTMNESIEKISDFSANLVTISNDITSAQGKFKAVAEAVILAPKKIKGGTLQVQHNIPGVKMEVNVKLDAVQLVKEIVTVNITHDPNNQKYIGLSNKKANISESADLI
jgi:hypothetical protein